MTLYCLIVVFILMLLTSNSHQDQQHQAVEMFKPANELLDNASKLPMEKQNAKKMFELVKPNLFGIVCNVKIESTKIGENLQKIHKNFCGQLNEGKSIEEIAQNMKKTVANTEIATINQEIFEKMPQKIQKLPFLNGKNKQIFRAFVGHLLVGNNFLTKIAASIKHGIANNKNNNKCSAKNKGRKRTKRGNDLESGNSAGENNNNNNNNNQIIYKRNCCGAKCGFVASLIVALVSGGSIALMVIQKHQIAANGQSDSLIGSMYNACIVFVLSLLCLLFSCCVIMDRCC